MGHIVDTKGQMLGKKTCVSVHGRTVMASSEAVMHAAWC
jgi:hypothetical protein